MLFVPLIPKIVFILLGVVRQLLDEDQNSPRTFSVLQMLVVFVHLAEHVNEQMKFPIHSNVYKKLSDKNYLISYRNLNSN